MSENDTVRVYLPMCRAIANNWYLPGSDRDDVLQEALVGLLKASRAYNGTGTFAGFARMVISRHLTACLRTATSGRNMLLAESLRAGLDDLGVTRDMVEGVEDALACSQRLLEGRERIRCLVDAMPSLTVMELEGWHALVNGLPTDRSERDDNKRRRAKIKMRAALAAAA